MFCDHIDVAALEYKEPQNNKNGGKVVSVSTIPGSLDWKDRIRFQMSENEKTNLQTAVWGLSTPMPGQDASRRTLELTIESKTLENFLSKLDERNVKIACDKSPNWFKKEMDEPTIRQMYVNIVKPPPRPDAKSSLRVKVKCGEYPTNVYVVKDDADGKLVYTKGGPDDLQKNVKCMVMVETSGLWFMSRQYGMSLTATEILVWPNRRTTGIDAFTLTNDVCLRKVVETNKPEPMEEDTQASQPSQASLF